MEKKYVGLKKDVIKYKLRKESVKTECCDRLIKWFKIINNRKFFVKKIDEINYPFFKSKSTQLKY